MSRGGRCRCRTRENFALLIRASCPDVAANSDPLRLRHFDVPQLTPSYALQCLWDYMCCIVRIPSKESPTNKTVYDLKRWLLVTRLDGKNTTKKSHPAILQLLSLLNLALVASNLPNEHLRLPLHALHKFRLRWAAFQSGRSRLGTLGPASLRDVRMHGVRGLERVFVRLRGIRAKIVPAFKFLSRAHICASAWQFNINNIDPHENTFASPSAGAKDTSISDPPSSLADSAGRAETPPSTPCHVLNSRGWRLI
ncbi:hypothetical protein BV25DRAFT_780326 [Artomyces pyxidatus]|uniref:Uncharacterized protein n=1 Tax=Artomyces pyxidatus TaxID=48021 RepID=A0ACB8SZG3_9AGAM|nr:hypothetical protein BV25DRAFT_780326 [Artomyces pyxidatus]